MQRSANKLEEVALLAGVSVSTVSRTLAGKAHVSEKARKKVLEAVNTLDYRPNMMARTLKLGYSSTIAVMIPSLDNLIYPAFVQGVQDEASRAGYMVTICNTGENKDVEEQFIRNSCNVMSVAGLIVSTIRNDSDHLAKLRDEGYPIVVAVRELDNSEFDTIVVDNFDGSKLMTKYLIDKGCHKIALVVGDRELSLYRKRYEGYMAALEEASIEYEDELVVNDKEDNNVQLINDINALIERRPEVDAIFATTDARAFAVTKALKDMGLKIPQDIRVAGFDGVALGLYMDPPLTTVRQPFYELGVQAVQQLLEQINARSSGDFGTYQRRRIVLKAELVIRQSA